MGPVITAMKVAAPYVQAMHAQFQPLAQRKAQQLSAQFFSHLKPQTGRNLLLQTTVITAAFGPMAGLVAYVWNHPNRKCTHPDELPLPN